MVNKIVLLWNVSSWWLRVWGVALIIIVAASLLQTTTNAFTMQSPQSASAGSGDSVNSDARHACWDAIESRATNKSSVDFHSFTAPPVVRKITEGRLDVFVKFSAKNAFGAESTSIARCILSGDGKTLIEFSAQDSL